MSPSLAPQALALGFAASALLSAPLCASAEPLVPADPPAEVMPAEGSGSADCGQQPLEKRVIELEETVRKLQETIRQLQEAQKAQKPVDWYLSQALKL